MKRYAHKCNSEHKTTMDIGLLYPIQFQDVIAGTTTYLDTSGLFRFQPLIAPAMVKLNAHIVHFYVPYRLLWDKWNDFISGQEQLELPMTYIQTGASLSGDYQWNFEKTLLDYAGFPSAYKFTKQRYFFFPYFWFLAYHKIWNEHFRDESIQDELDISQMAAEFEGGFGASDYNNGTGAKWKKLFGLRRVNWGRDRFTKALLETEADPTIQLPVGQSGDFKFKDTQGTTYPVIIADASGGANLDCYSPNVNKTSSTHPGNLKYASGLTGVDLTDFKLATALYNFKINQNKYGKDVEAYFRKYGLKNMDMRLQRSEVIGGFAETMQISDVIATSDTNLGKQGGHAVGYAKKRRFKHYAPEQGVIITMAYLRPKADYNGGIPRFFLKRDMLDFYQAEFANIGYQTIYKAELGLAKDMEIPKDEDKLKVFGYEPRYEEYRRESSVVSGEVRPDKPLAHWANPRFWGDSSPELNSNFLECNPSNQIWASPNTDKCIAYFKRNVSKLCFVPKFSDPKIKL